MSYHDTIVAVSSPPGRAARGLIRISGGDTLSILAQLTSVQPIIHAILPCRLLHDRLPALLAFFAGPRSYTGGDLAELHLPGNPALLDRILHQIIALGGRLAEPGEFTFRAYLAGKLDLTQAEGISATIAATSDAQLRAASLLREGKLGELATQFVDEVGTSLALVEAGIDFTDQDDVVPITPAKLDANLTAIEANLDDLLLHSRSWGSLEALPRIVLVGPPSAGKSTLFNALLGRERAVISETPGTTRDLLAEPMAMKNQQGEMVEVMLIDIAGLDDPRSVLDHQMQDAAKIAIASADLILLIADDANGFVSNTSLPQSTPTLRVQTKADLRSVALDENQIDETTLHISAKTGLHLDRLRQLILTKLGERAVSISADMLALQPRHELALKQAQHDLATARALLSYQRSEPAIAQVELIAGAMRSALDHLAGLGGTLTPDDVIGRVFATFCIGK